VERGLLEHARGERLIATGRIMLALFTAVVVYVDPDVSRSQLRLLPMAAAFAAYAVILTIIGWRLPMVAMRARLGVHVVDFLLFSLFIELTHASVSPFFVFFLFSLLTALVRFGVRGLLITAGAAIATYLGMAFSDEMIRSDPGFLIMRVTSLSVATLLLAYVGAYYERVQSELAKLAAWPALASDQPETTVRETLSLACNLTRSPRAMLVWEEEEEPWTSVAVLSGGDVAINREPPGFLEAMVNAAAREVTFLERSDEKAVLLLDRRPRSESGSALTAVGRERLGAQSVLSAAVRGRTVTGRIFFLDRRSVHIDDVAVAEIVARLVAARLDQLNIAARTRLAAVAQERLRVARDLHDGVLQSLTGASLQLEMTSRLIETDKVAAQAKLRTVQDLIAADHAELRTLINTLRPDASIPRPNIKARLDELAQRLHRQWDVEMVIAMEPPSVELPDRLVSEIYNIIGEGAVNAAKHAAASRIAVELFVGAADVAMIVSDNGRGFPFTGTYTLEELNAARRGPVTLKERVAALNGDLILYSTPKGSRVDIRIKRGAGPPGAATLQNNADPHRAGR
jgi:signal transduction histidine kinase